MCRLRKGAWQRFRRADSIALALRCITLFPRIPNKAQLHVAMHGSSQAVHICPQRAASPSEGQLLTPRRRPPAPCAARSRWSGGRKWRLPPPDRCLGKRQHERGRRGAWAGILCATGHAYALGASAPGCWLSMKQRWQAGAAAGTLVATRGPPQVDHAGGGALGTVPRSVVEMKRVSLHSKCAPTQRRLGWHDTPCWPQKPIGGPPECGSVCESQRAIPLHTTRTA